VQPSIILIDNVTDHIEVDRHLTLMKHLPDCFPGSQLITTCHSTTVQKNFPDRDKILDLRVLYAPDYVAEQTWRLRLKDELRDVKDALESCTEDVEKLKEKVGMVDAVIMNPESNPTQAANFTADFISECARTICNSRVGFSTSRISTRKNRADD
jgi:hypothetical protein